MIKQMLASESKPKVLALFVLVTTGILSKWFWNLGWTYLQDPSTGLDFGTPTILAVRVALSLIAAGLTFIPTYNKIGQSTGDSWVPYCLAFQNGFLSHQFHRWPEACVGGDALMFALPAS